MTPSEDVPGHKAMRWAHRVVSGEKELWNEAGQGAHPGEPDARNTCSVWKISQAGGGSLGHALEECEPEQATLGTLIRGQEF